MRAIATIIWGASITPFCLAQVNVDVPVQFTGTDIDRTVQGLAAPAQADAMITVEGSLRAEWAWATASLQADTLNLSFPVPPATVRDGMLLRFAAPSVLEGALWARLPGMDPLQLVRVDGLPFADGYVVQGQVCEVLFANGRFNLMSTAAPGCPSGYLQVNDHYCISSYSSNPVFYYEAVDECASRGGKLCTWNEYQAACELLTGQFDNMFADWEWIDETANHLHTMVQAGRTSCEGERSRIVTSAARVRCCHQLR